MTHQHGCKGKRAHRSKTSAIAAAIRLSRNNVPLRVYFHSECGRWHLTSRPAWEATDATR